MLSRYGEMFEPEDVHSLSESEQSLREVIRRREQLVSQRVQEKNRLEKGLNGAGIDRAAPTRRNRETGSCAWRAAA